MRARRRIGRHPLSPEEAACPGSLKGPISRRARATWLSLYRVASVWGNARPLEGHAGLQRRGWRGRWDRRERLTAAAVADTPNVMTDGKLASGRVHRRVGVRRAGPEAGRGVLSRAGWPDAGAGAAGENLGVEWAPIEVREDGLRHSVRIGDAVDFEIEDIVPFGVETGEPARLTGIFHPAGSELTVAHATRSRIDAFGIQYDGTAAFSTSRFSWAA